MLQNRSLTNGTTQVHTLVDIGNNESEGDLTCDLAPVELPAIEHEGTQSFEKDASESLSTTDSRLEWAENVSRTSSSKNCEQDSADDNAAGSSAANATSTASTPDHPQILRIGVACRESEDALGGTGDTCTAPAARCQLTPGSSNVVSCTSTAGDGLPFIPTTSTTDKQKPKKPKKKKTKQCAQIGQREIANDGAIIAREDSGIRSAETHQTISDQTMDHVLGLMHMATTLQRSPMDMLGGFNEKLKKAGAPNTEFCAAVRALTGLEMT